MMMAAIAARICGCLMTVLCLSSAAWATSYQASTPQVKASLVASHATVSPGLSMVLAVKLEIAPHWHTYWRNPGDSGTVTTIDWKFSQPVTAGEIAWPLPERFRMGPIVNYGYANQVTLPTPISLPADLALGKRLHVEAVVDWLVCKEECIPQQVTLALDLPVVPAAQHTQPTTVAQLQPVPVANFPVHLVKQANGLQLLLDSPALKQSVVEDVWFYPYEWGRIAQSQPQRLSQTEAGIALALTAGDQPLQTGQALHGVLVVKRKQGQATSVIAYTLSPKLSAAVKPLQPSPDSPAPEVEGLGWALFLAFAGGLVLNLMPCVFPVLSMKALSMISHAQLTRRALRTQGWIYTFGVVLSFVLLALLLLALKAGGAEIGWGFQFQSPWFVCLMAYVMFAVGLSLSGVFDIGVSVTGVGSDLADQPGLWGSFFTGVLATVVATPCTAPFMAAALGFALTRPAPELLLIFVSLGLGLAFPYLLLTYWPRLQRLLPKPGVWMEYTKQLFAFPMYGASLWLVWVLAQQQGPLAVGLSLSGLLLIAFAAWVYAISRATTVTKRWLATVTISIALLAALWLVTRLSAAPTSTAAASHTTTNTWQPYSAEKLQQLLAEGKPVFLNFTAAWCISCLVNEKVALSQPAVQQIFQQQGITYLKGDWTNKDAAITQVLTQFGRSGVPLYVFYPAGQPAQPVVLPQILTPAIVLSHIQPSSSFHSSF